MSEFDSTTIGGQLTAIIGSGKKFPRDVDTFLRQCTEKCQNNEDGAACQIGVFGTLPNANRPVCSAIKLSPCENRAEEGCPPLVTEQSVDWQNSSEYKNYENTGKSFPDVFNGWIDAHKQMDPFKNNANPLKSSPWIYCTYNECQQLEEMPMLKMSSTKKRRRL